MELFTKIAWVVMLGIMVIVLLPRAKAMIEEGKQGKRGDWMSALFPLGLVVLFVIFLIVSVSS